MLVRMGVLRWGSFRECELVFGQFAQAHGLFALAMVSGRGVLCAIVLHGLYVQHGGPRVGLVAGIVYDRFVGLFGAAIAVVVEVGGAYRVGDDPVSGGHRADVAVPQRPGVFVEADLGVGQIQSDGERLAGGPGVLPGVPPQHRLACRSRCGVQVRALPLRVGVPSRRLYRQNPHELVQFQFHVGMVRIRAMKRRRRQLATRRWPAGAPARGGCINSRGNALLLQQVPLVTRPRVLHADALPFLLCGRPVRRLLPAIPLHRLQSERCATSVGDACIPE